MYTIEIVKDKFWILEDAGIKLGTIRRTKSSDFEVIIREDGFETLSLDALTSRFGSKILTPREFKKIESVEYGKDIDEVEGYPSKHRAYNKALDENGIPVYTKTEKSKVLYAAGYYGLHFTGVWRNTYCVKRETLDNYEFIGPFKTKTHLEAEINRCTNQ